MGEHRSLLGRIVTWTVLGILAIVAVKLALRLLGFLLGLVGIVFGVALFAVFTLGPVILLGWLSVKAWRAFTKEAPVV